MSKIETTSKVSLKLTNKINLRRRDARAPSSRFWKQPTSLPHSLERLSPCDQIARISPRLMQKCKMPTTVSKTLTYHTAQSYPLKRQIYYAPATNASPGKLWTLQKQPPEVLYEKSYFKNFAIFTAKLQTRNHIKQRLQHKCFSLNIANFLRTPILKNTC